MKLTRLAVVLVGVVIFALAACIPSLPTGEVRPPSTSVTPSESESDSAAKAAIKDVIQRANSEQEQAIARRDSSVMKDTSTDSYYQDVVQVNQTLLDNGVASIKLLAIEWGSITVAGDRAQATAWETWATTSTEAYTTRSRERNEYRLVRQGGEWKIQSNEHPDNILPPLPIGPTV